jgi:hypothetical protein
MPIFLKSGSLKLLEPSGPVQACNGIALPLPSHLITELQMCSIEITADATSLESTTTHPITGHEVPEGSKGTDVHFL